MLTFMACSVLSDLLFVDIVFSFVTGAAVFVTFYLTYVNKQHFVSLLGCIISVCVYVCVCDCGITEAIVFIKLLAASHRDSHLCHSCISNQSQKSSYRIKDSFFCFEFL